MAHVPRHLASNVLTGIIEIVALGFVSNCVVNFCDHRRVVIGMVPQNSAQIIFIFFA